MGAYEHRCGEANGEGFVDVVDLLGVVYAFGTLRATQVTTRAVTSRDRAVDVVDLLDLVYNFGK